MNLLRGVETHCESIFCLYDELPSDLVSAMEKSAVPVLEWTERQGVTHSLSRISEPKVVQRMMTELSAKRLLIADGHHRYETSVKYAQENPTDERKQFVMATLISTNDPGLIVRPTHRLLSGMEISEDDLINGLEGFFYLRIFDRLPEMIERPYRVQGNRVGPVDQERAVHPARSPGNRPHRHDVVSGHLRLREGPAGQGDRSERG